jgi:hypothetical protein
LVARYDIAVERFLRGPLVLWGMLDALSRCIGSIPVAMTHSITLRDVPPALA